MCAWVFYSYPVDVLQVFVVAFVFVLHNSQMSEETEDNL